MRQVLNGAEEALEEEATLVIRPIPHPLCQPPHTGHTVGWRAK